MPNPDPNIWAIVGSAVEVDRSTPFNRGSLGIFEVSGGNETNLGIHGIEIDGSFSVALSKNSFPLGAPNLIIRIYDYQQRVLCMSAPFVPSDNFSPLHLVLERMPIPETWNVHGIAFEADGSTRFTQGQIEVFNGETNGWLANTGLSNNNDGSFTLTFNRSQFQNGDIEKAAPTVNFRIYDYQNNTLWTCGPITLPHSNYYINPLINNSGPGSIVPDIPEVSENWSVIVNVLRNGEALTANFTVKAFDCLYEAETELGAATQTDPDGKYVIAYNKSAFQNGDSGRVAPNLLVKVFFGGAAIAESGLFEQANNPEEIDVYIDSNVDINGNGDGGGEGCNGDGNEVDNAVPQDWEISGTVTKHDASPMASGRVDVWDVCNNQEFPVGSCELDSNGDYLVAFAKDKFQRNANSDNSKRRHPNLLIRLYDSCGIMLCYRYLEYEDSEQYICDISLEQAASQYHVSGKISNTLGFPVSDSIVIVKNLLLKGGKFYGTELGRGISGKTPLNGTQGSTEPGVYNIRFYPMLVEELKEPDALGAARFVVEVYRISEESVLGETMEYPLCLLEFAGKSNLIKAAEEKLLFDFAIDAPSNADVSTFTNIHDQLFGSEFTEDETSGIIELASDNSKLEYAAEVTGILKEDILEFALAQSILSALKYKLSGDAAISEVNNLPGNVNLQVMYALVKTGNAKSFRDLLKITAARLQTVLISAITQSIVPPSVQDNLPDIISEWQEIYILLLTEDIDASNAGRIFWHAMLKSKTHEDNEYCGYYERVVEIYTENSHDVEKFWSGLEEELLGDEENPVTEEERVVINSLINRLKFFFDIHKFADEFGPLSNAMMDYVYAANEQSEKEEYAALEDFVKLEKTEWLEDIIGGIEQFDENTEWPESVPGESDEEKRSNYAAVLYKRIIELFSMDRFRADLEKAINADGFEDSNWWQPVSAFLNIKKAFDFADNIADNDFYCDCDSGDPAHDASCKEEAPHYISGFGEEQISGLSDKLLIAQRLYRLTPKFGVIAALIKKGFTSAMSIAHKNCDEFVKGSGNLVGGIDDAQALHAAAVHTASQALFLMGAFNQQTDLPEASIPAVTDKLPSSDQGGQGQSFQRQSAPSAMSKMQSMAEPAVFSKSAAPLVNTIKPIIPNIATLFGTQNQSLCEECQSVFSPSAYMADLLEFLNDNVRSELLSRRPDLAETDLSCRNTHGGVAYIDLVNEILENAVCPRSFDSTNGFFLTLKNRIDKDSKSSFAIRDAGDDAAFSTVAAEFGSQGFYVDKEFYVQPIEKVGNKWYIVGDGMRYLVESLGDGSNFKITSYPQTGKDAQLRRVKPEHTHWRTYNHLKELSYPANLPFNLPFIEVNEFLKLKKTSRHELYNALRAESADFNENDEALNNEALAFLEMTNRQRDLISDNANLMACELWGFSSDDELMDSLGNAEAVMKKLDITLDQFLDLMHTYFICVSDSDDLPHLDWGEGSAYENGELDKLEIKNCNPADYLRMARLQRLSNHLGLDVITVDRLLSMHRLATDSENAAAEIDNVALSNISRYLKIAKEFSVTPIRAASWLCCWIENFNLGRGKPSLFEELFLSNIDSPERAAIWKEMLNDVEEGIRDFAAGGGANDKDIATLLKSLNVSYPDLSLIASEEFDIHDSDEAWEILGNGSAKLTLKNLAKMFRVADFSKALKISVVDFYKLKSVLDTAAFTPEFLMECRALAAKLKRFKISLDEYRYLLSGESAAEISWLPSEGDDLNAIIKIHDEIVKTKQRYSADSPDLAEAIEETILNEFAAMYKISVDTCRIVFEKALEGDPGKSLLQHWVDICAVEWEQASESDDAPAVAPEDSFNGVSGYLGKVANIAFLITTLKITVEEFDFLVEYLRNVYGLDFNELGMPEAVTGQALSRHEALAALLDVYVLDTELPFKNKEFTVFNLLNEARNPNPAIPLIDVIAREIDWQRKDVETVAGKNLFDFAQVDAWFVLNRALGLLKKLGLTASFANTLISKTDETRMSESEALIGALKATYTQSQWIEAAEPIRNNIRRLQRDALCACLLRGGEFANRAAIYAKYLIDINMDTDVMTTRIVQANSSIQMFLQRALLNFETIELDDKIKQQWPWMKNYRLWEANRKIFLYPENWLEPEFRDDKTPLFKELESAMLQKELNPSNIKEAFKAYASGLSEIANLEVIGAHSEEGQGGKILHVIGRTFRYPHSYYYRRHHDITGGPGYWTPWEKVDLDITADVVLPVPFRNKIYIFWPVIEVKDKAVPNNEEGENKDKSKFSDSFKYYEIKLAWSEFSDGKWSAKRISINSYIHDAESIDNDLTKPTDLFHFKADASQDAVEIQAFAYNKTIEEFTVKTKIVQKVPQVIYGKGGGMRGLFSARRVIDIPVIREISEVIKKEKEAISKVASFSFGADNSARLIPIGADDDNRNYMESEMIPPGTAMRHNRAEESEARQNSSDFGALEYPAGNVLLKRTPERFVCFPANLSFFGNTPAPFFLKLNEKTLFVKPIHLPDQFSYGKEQAVDSKNTTYHHIVNFYHPLADDLVRKANLNSIDDLLNRAVQANSRGDQYPLGYAAVGDEHAAHLADLSFRYQYLPQKNVIGGYPVPINDFSMSSAFGVYNWELFFHLPMYIAARLSHDKQYEEAMRWFHYIFNPALDFTTWEKTQRWTWDLPGGARFWNFLPFFANKGVQDSIYKAVEKSQIPDQDTMLGSLIEDWKNDPFKPHLIARVRTAAYQKSVVMKYLDNLIEWGDSLFRLDHMEAINEATQLYTQASEILGERPVLVPKLHEMPGLTYRQLKAQGLDQFSNAVINLENYIPPSPPVKARARRAKQAPSRYYYYHYNYNYSYSYNRSVEAVPHRSMQLLRMAPALHYFCMPRNERLTGYWDLVEDRLFKIRHSMNIDGVKRVMPLFAPPIDPGMLARAAGMGININALLRDMQSSPTAYRFAAVFQKAAELCNELKSFGSELLGALEKKDAEALALLRSNHEIELLKLVKDIKKKTIEESTQSLEALHKTKAVTEERYNYYKEIEKTSEGESQQLNASYAAGGFHLAGQAAILASGPIKLLPDGFLGALVGLSGGALSFANAGGGEKGAESMKALGEAFNALAGISDRIASISGIKSSYERRWQEWKLQEKLAEKELAQLGKQILCAEIRLQIAEKDLGNHEKQIEQAQALKEVMESKFSNEKLYQWMSDELNKSYNKMYDIAYSAAKKAEKAFQFELGNSKSFISPEIWDSARKGLLAGNRLAVQLRQMDAAYIENNKRELEITKAVSLSMLNGEQQLKLRETGSCEFELPEWIYDLDCPGHYFRRIKSVRVTIPCVAGPYTNISAKLTLTGSKVRVNPMLKDGKYEEDADNDVRFLYGPIPSASISTSGANMDSGMFEFNFRDERYLPFEGAGAISKWRLEFPADFRQFNYGTITDVILHVSYTAREAASTAFKDGVTAYLHSFLEKQELIPSLISLKCSFYEQFESIANGDAAEISLNREELFHHLIIDYWRRKNAGNVFNINGKIKKIMVFVLLKNKGGDNADLEISVNGVLPPATLSPVDDEEQKLYECKLDYDGSEPWNLSINNAMSYEIEDIFLYFGYPIKEEEGR